MDTGIRLMRDPVDTMVLTVRAASLLRKAGIDTVAHLCETPDDDLRVVCRSRERFKEVQAVLAWTGMKQGQLWYEPIEDEL
jgi:DNA-directed RNA polymerase alpha subunit